MQRSHVQVLGLTALDPQVAHKAAASAASEAMTQAEAAADSAAASARREQPRAGGLLTRFGRDRASMSLSRTNTMVEEPDEAAQGSAAQPGLQQQGYRAEAAPRLGLMGHATALLERLHTQASSSLDEALAQEEPMHEPILPCDTAPLRAAAPGAAKGMMPSAAWLDSLRQVTPLHNPRQQQRGTSAHPAPLNMSSLFTAALKQEPMHCPAPLISPFASAAAAPWRLTAAPSDLQQEVPSPRKVPRMNSGQGNDMQPASGSWAFAHSAPLHAVTQGATVHADAPADPAANTEHSLAALLPIKPLAKRGKRRPQLAQLHESAPLQGSADQSS